MECAPDWQTTLRRASLDGVAFEVTQDSISYGKRMKVHEFPHRDRPFVEELGEKAIEFSVTAYVASDNALAESAALVKAARRKGAQTLILPVEGALQVKCYKCTRNFNKDQLGYIAFDLSFHEAGAGFGVFSIALLERLVGVAAETTFATFVNDLAGLYRTAGEPSWVAQAAVDGIEGWLVALDDARAGLTAPPATLSSMRSVITAAHRDVDLLAHTGLTTGGEDLFTLSSGVLESVRLGADPIDAVALFDQLVTRAPAMQIALDLAPSVAAERRNEEAINAAVRRASLVQWAMTAAAMDYRDRPQAIEMRARLAERFDEEMTFATGAALQGLSEIRGRVALVISRKIADMRPLTVIEARSSVPAIVWSWRLYAVADKAAELARRNRVRHPALMPETFEAEAL